MKYEIWAGLSRQSKKGILQASRFAQIPAHEVKKHDQGGYVNGNSQDSRRVEQA